VRGDSCAAMAWAFWAFSPIMIVGECVQAFSAPGIIEASATRSPGLADFRALPLSESVRLFAGLMTVRVPEDRYPRLSLTAQQQRDATLETGEVDGHACGAPSPERGC
jgi:hypothetical protein